MKKILLSPFLGCLGFLLLPSVLFAETGEGVKAWIATDATVPIQAGKPFTATVVLDLQPGFHTYWQYPGDSGLAPKVTWHLPEGWKAGPIEFAIPHQFSESGDMIVYGYEKQQLLRAVITPPKELPRNQTFEIKASLTWLACKELCVPGSADVELGVLGPTDGPIDWQQAIVPKGAWPESGSLPFSVSFSGKGINKLVSFTGQGGATYELYPDPAEGMTVGHVTRISSQGAKGPALVFSIPWEGPAPFRGLLVEQNGGQRKGWWVLNNDFQVTDGKADKASLFVLLAALFSGFLGGLILNLMPCVLPVISLKIFSFIAQAGESPKRIFRHGLAFAAGIFLWFLGLGLLVIALKAGGSQVTWGAFQFQNPLFVVGLSVLVFLFALNLFGLFEITLPGNATDSLDQTARRAGYGGSFFQGLFATLLATPCTAPFLGSALGFAFGQSSLVILAMFASVALGMSLPYLLLSAQPGWRKWIPKPGVWMERLKQFMGFPLLATNLWLFWVLQNQRGNEAALILLALFLILGLCAWLFGILSGAGSRGRIWPLLLIALLALAAIVFTAQRISIAQPSAIKTSGAGDGIAWVHYTPDALAALRAEGKPVFLDFTASWCLTCQFNERAAINVPAVRKLMKEKGIVAMKGDWTNADPAITVALKSFDRVGVPLVVFYPVGKGSEPMVLPELLTEKIVLEALGK
ncbi:MAG: thioredoxin family protein [Verrucomicrobiota bacterium]